MLNAKSEALRRSLPFTSLRGALVCALALAASASPAWGQDASEPVPETNQALFAPLRLLPPGRIRTATGRPGPAYWQQRADYSIRVSLDPESHRVRGSENIRYTNNSPDDLEDLWLQLDQNLFRTDSRGAVVNSSNRWRGSFPDGGDRLERVELVEDGARRAARYTVDDTRMHIRLDHPLRARGGRIDIEIDWSFIVPEYGADRMGRFKGEDGWVYELAQWYPRMYVYDDVAGWNPMPYLGQGEFYLEYGDFQVEITVPHDFQVVATGQLTNPEEVLTARQRERLQEARRSAETVAIVRPEEVGVKSGRPAGRGPLTWRYRAESVRDFAWAASKAFILDATSWQDVLIMSAYPKEALGPDKGGKPGWEQAAQFARHTISYYSNQWYRYPYPVAINVAGAVGGMEYPMIVFCSVRARGQGLFGVTDHEFGHTWFPMIVGSDERRYAWMDEGFNTFLNHYSNLAYFGSEATRAQRTNPDFIARRMQEPISDQPIMTWPDLLRRQGLGFMGYRKPGFGLILLREVILGPERFDRAFRAYIRHWAFKHPQPSDFFRSMEESTGEDLDWFWRGWFYGTDLLDQAVDGIAVKDGHTEIRVSNREGLVMPAELEIRMGDGSSVRRTLPVEVWMTSDIFTMNLAGTPDVVQVTIDPDHRLPDVRRENNTWRAAPAAAGGGG